VQPLKAGQSTSNSKLRCSMLLHVIGNDWIEMGIKFHTGDMAADCIHRFMQ
jgi:hypothetical protein